MRFAKYQGLGNDFIVVDLRAASPAEAAAVQDPKTVIALCDRQFGVGADGVLAVLPASGADARMRVLNSDGSGAEMCGNGIRCVAKELYDRGGVHKDQIEIDTGAGRLSCAIDAASGVVRSVTVTMGAPRLARRDVPMAGPPDERCVEQPIEIAGASPRSITAVSMGNPHAVVFTNDGSGHDELRRTAELVGPAIESHPAFPKGTNVEFARVTSRREIDLVVWERGCGITLACGTGACATAVAAILGGHADEGVPIQVNLPGGSLEITVLPGLANVLMKGPAVLVFDGELALDRLTPGPSGPVRR